MDSQDGSFSRLGMYKFWTLHLCSYLCSPQAVFKAPNSEPLHLQAWHQLFLLPQAFPQQWSLCLFSALLKRDCSSSSISTDNSSAARPWKKIIEKEGNQQKLQKYIIAVNMCKEKRKSQGAPSPTLTWTNTDAGGSHQSSLLHHLNHLHNLHQYPQLLE